MESVALALALVGVYVAGLLSSCVAAALLIRRAVRTLASDSTLAKLHEAVAEARTWNSRLLATIRWAGQTVQPTPAAPARPSAPAQAVAALSQAVGVPVPPDVAKAAAAGGMEEVEVPDALVRIAAGAGVDIGKVLAGDDTEMAKAKQLLAVIGQRGGAPAGPNGFGGPPPGEDYL